MTVLNSPINWLFIVELVVIVIVTTAFLFYWNRILGLTLGAIIRLGIWNSYNAYLDIGSLQISPLAGRIAFRNVEYRSSNISGHVVDGNITFRYWIFRVRQGDSSTTNGKRGRLPCRIVINLEGFELFVYNRTPAYENIVERMRKHEENDEGISFTVGGENGGIRQRKTPMSRETTNSSRRKEETTTQGTVTSSGEPQLKSSEAASEGWMTRAFGAGLSWAASALPIDVRIHQGSVSLGSDATPMVIILDTKRGNGTIELSEPRSPYDWYRLSFNFHLQEMNILMRTNHDYTGTLLAHGKRVYDDLLEQDPVIKEEPPSEIASRPGFRWLLKKFPALLDSKFAARPIAVQQPTGQWKGLARYRLEDEGVPAAKVQREERQYAKVTTLLATKLLDLSYFYDCGGPAPIAAESVRVDPNDKIGNVDLPPEYGIDLGIHGGAVNYGPWTDRQRDALLKAFAPSIFFDTEPKKRLAPGEPRVPIDMVVNIMIKEKMTLRIPTREPSKDWMYDNAHGDVERKYGWLDVVVGANSSVMYNQAQIATKDGYDSMIALHLDELDIASSVNLESFAVAQTCKLFITMPVPLTWNAQRNWGIDLTLDTPDILLMREHITLFSDLAKDWSSGGPGDFHHFVPMHYSFRVTLINFMIHLFINDFNIVDAPRSMEANAFLDIHGPRIESYVAVASTHYRPEFSTVPFTIYAKDALVNLRLPSWDTHRTFNPEPSMEVGRIGDITVNGSYRYYAGASPDHQEKLKLNLDAENVAFKAFGWVVRRMFCVKDNYFGAFTQFSTMQEFLEKFDHSPDSVGDPIVEKYRPGRSDSFAVNMTVNVRDSLVVMSDEIYGSEKGIVIPVQQLQLDLRNNEYQMDMSVDLAPTYVSACDDLERCYQSGSTPLAKDQDVVFVEGVDIKANRLFGPQPKGTTYICLWELSFGHVSAFLTPTFTDTLAAVGSAVGYNYTDRDNAPSAVYLAKTPPDATFVKLSVRHVTALLTTGDSGAAIELPQGVFLDTSSVASQACRSVQGLGVPCASIHLLRKRDGHKTWQPVGSITTGVSMDTYKVPPGWKEDAEKQQEFLREHDEPTKRVPFLYGEKDDPAYGRHEHEIYVPRPRPTEPSWDDEASLYTYEEANDSSSSPNESDGSDSLSIPMSRVSRRRRAMSRARAAEVESLFHEGDSSIGDESDTCSTFSSSTSSSSNTSVDDGDPAAIFERKLAAFKKIHERAQRLFSHEPSTPSPFVQEPQDLFEPLCITEGTVQRVSFQPTMIEMTPATIEAAAYLAAGMKATVPRPEVQLDQLLTYQVDSLLKNGLPRNPKLFVIDAPLAEARLVAGHSVAHPDSVTRIAINSCNSRVLSTPIVDSTKSITEATFGIGSLTLTAYRNGAPPGSLALSDIPDVPVPTEPKHNKLLPYTLARALDFGVTLHQEPESVTIQSKVTALEVHSATPGVPVISNILDLWMPVIKNLPKSDLPNTTEWLLYDILTQAIATGTSLSLPAFMYEASYGLHLDDQRNIRRDVGWGFIQRLRYWMRQMEQHGQMRPNVLRPGGPSMAKTIVVDLAKVDDGFGQTAETIADIPFLSKVLGKDLQAAGCAPPAIPSQLSVFIRLEDGEVRHYGRQLQTDAIAWSKVKIEAASVAYANLKTWVQNMPLSNVRSVISVRSIDFDLKDSSFAANEAIIRHIDEHRKEIKELKVVEAVEGASTVVIDVHLDNFRAGLTFGGMRGETCLKNGQVAVTMERSCRNGNEGSLQLEQRTCIFNCAALDNVLAKFPDDPHDDHTAPVPMITSALHGIKAGIATNFNSQDNSLSFQRILVGLETLDFDSRPQLKHFYEFLQEWRRRFWPLYEPYWKKFEALIAKQKVRSQQKYSPALQAPPSPEKTANELSAVGERMIDAFVGKARLQLRGSEKLWLRWDMNRIYGSFRGTPEASKFGGRIDPQTIGGYSQYECIKDKQASIISLPEITGTGNYDETSDKKHLGLNIAIGMFTGIIKPIVLDRLLSLHQKVGKDVTLIIRELKSTWGDKSPKSEPSRLLQPPDLSRPEKAKSPPVQWSFDAQTSIAGVRVGLRAENVPTTLMFEALDLQASASNVDRPSIEWMAKANHVGLSLIRLKDRHGLRSTAKPLQGSRSASMVFDFSAEEIPGNPSRLNIEFRSVHTVMHIAALSEVSDLIRSWSADLNVLREVHKEEVDDVKEEATKVFKKIEGSHISNVSTGTQESNATAIESWLKSRVLKLGIHGFGIAIPLDEDAAIDLAKRHSSDVPALLFSIRAMDLKTSRTETARFKVLNTELQFVKSFDPGHPEQFVGDFHSTDDKMKLPNIEAEAQLTSSATELLAIAHCQATDFHLCLTPDIADGVGKLVDLYERGKTQLEVLEKEYLSEWTKGTNDSSSQPESLQSKYDTQIPTTPKAVTVRMSFRFHSGLVELYRPTATKSRRIHRDKKPDHDLVVLPSVSLWMEYLGPTGSEDNVRTLLFNTAVHESKNVLRPTILPFFTELVSRIERRAKSRVATGRTSAQETPAPSQISNRSPELPLLDVGERTDRAMAKVEDAPTGKIRLRVTLRIDKSELRLSCKDDSSAYLDLKWESGGFVAATLLGGKQTTTLAGTVSGVTVFLSHEFATEGQGCIEGGAKDLAFSVALCSEEGNRERGLSIVVDTGVSAEFQLAGLSAWLEFACVWIENAPKLDVSNKDAPPSSMTSTSAALTSTSSASTVHTSTNGSAPVRSKLGVAALVRFRSIEINAKLPVTHAQLKMAPIVLRTVTDGEETELALTVGETTIRAEGEVSGNVTSESLKFHTIRRSSRSAASFAADPTVLKMSIDGGDLRGAAFIGDNNIVRFRLEPSQVTLADNWKDHAHDQAQPVSLDFIVDAGQFTGVLKLPLIPRLLSMVYQVLDQIGSQETVAAQRSKTFRLRAQKKAESNNAVMVLNSATAPSTPTADEKHSPPVLVRTAQLMKFELKGLDVGLFVNDYDDGTVADFLRFYVGKIGADLTRSQDEQSRPVRNLRLHVDFVEWQTCDGRRAAKVEQHGQLAGELISAAMKNGYKIVVVLPRMVLDMKSTQDGQEVLYDFDVLWGETDGDVKVVPKFLGFALKSFRKLHSDIKQQQLDRAKKRGDVRAQSAAALRKAKKKDPNAKDPEEMAADSLQFKSRNPKTADYPLPKLKALGDTTGDAAAFLDWASSQHIKNAVRMLPEYSHKFVTLPLEEGMDLLLKLYQKQLPDLDQDTDSPSQTKTQQQPLRTHSISEEDPAEVTGRRRSRSRSVGARGRRGGGG